MRTALEIVRNAAPRMGIDQPEVLFTSTDRQEIEVRGILQDAAEYILQQNDWSLLRTVNTDTGDGTTTAFALPSDYHRMTKDARVWSSRWQRPLIAITPEDDLRLEVRDYDIVTGTWMIQGGNINYRPALTATETAKWYYVSNAIIAPSSGASKARFTADSDVFRLGDRLIELHLIWMWRAHKKLDYGEEMQSAEIALADAIGRDGGARILTQASRQNFRADTAYPLVVET
ncbi:hypothetical protein [uncultured Roseobacter sp.]|uniref:phage adaptor protein n=1 Tax=uncultured Roseobacter sp. TaxID=114847 RepID=UPI00261B6F37|nr:hypothetical protein [uncultured Roseobacter sp.]